MLLILKRSRSIPRVLLTLRRLMLKSNSWLLRLSAALVVSSLTIPASVLLTSYNIVTMSRAKFGRMANSPFDSFSMGRLQKKLNGIASITSVVVSWSGSPVAKLLPKSLVLPLRFWGRPSTTTTFPSAPRRTPLAKKCVWFYLSIVSSKSRLIL